ncbi:MAG: hypothetical protein EBX40_06070 [Gammaproteobacteria bacterium]|nr:hypothetical protein [Gammaproteobacteria bacterium]
MKRFSLLSVLGVCLFLTGCGSDEKTYHGVPGNSWGQLNGEQKQLIVDYDFNKFMNGDAQSASPASSQNSNNAAQTH